jgi:hypothetical protein
MRKWFDKWLELGDENFVLAIQNDANAKKRLAILHGQRAIQLIGILGMFLIEFLVIVYSAIFNPSELLVAFSFLTIFIVVALFNFTSLDTQIKTIKMAMFLKSTQRESITKE